MKETEQEDLLREVEIRVAGLTRRYERLQGQLRTVEDERDKLLLERDELQQQVEALTQQFSVVALSQDDEQSQVALSRMDEELTELIETVESCLALLDTKLGNGVKG